MIRTLAVLALVDAAGGFVARPRPRAATARRASDADLLAAAAGVGRGMAAKRKNKHVNKYQKDEVKEDPGSVRCARRRRRTRPRRRRPRTRCRPTASAKAPRWRGSAALRRSVLDFDARDPSTFGFQELGRVVGAHGVRGALRVDAPSAVDVEAALLAEGLRHLRLAPEGAAAGRRGELSRAEALRGYGAICHVALKGLNEREEAARLAGAVLYRGATRDAEESVGLRALDEARGVERGRRAWGSGGRRLGTCWTRTRARRSPRRCWSSSSKRRGTASCPWTRAASRSTRAARRPPDTALLDLAFDYAPPPRRSSGGSRERRAHCERASLRRRRWRR